MPTERAPVCSICSEPILTPDGAVAVGPGLLHGRCFVAAKDVPRNGAAKPVAVQAWWRRVLAKCRIGGRPRDLVRLPD